ncbi:MAG TPA: hypothetical protein VGP44_08300 [Gemmatimonadales bacterium]|nr:hypothetical protein [Gemmatimonadales bacterium]
MAYNPGTPTTTYSLPDGTLAIPSWRGEAKAHVVDLQLSRCTCGNYVHVQAKVGGDCKHLKQARAEKFAALVAKAKTQTTDTLNALLTRYEAAGKLEIAFAIRGELLDRTQQVTA